MIILVELVQEVQSAQLLGVLWNEVVMLEECSDGQPDAEGIAFGEQRLKCLTNGLEGRVVRHFFAENTENSQ